MSHHVLRVPMKLNRTPVLGSKLALIIYASRLLILGGLTEWKTLRVSHIPTPPATTTNYLLTKRYTNIPLGTKDRSDHCDLRLRFGLPLRPPRLHHRRQFLPHGSTHRIATSMFLRGSLSLLWCSLALPFCPTLFHRCRNTLAGCRAQTATFLDTRRLSLAHLARTTTPCGLGT